MSGFDYYKVELRLITEMLGTCCEASIYDKHILQKAKKEIAKVNKIKAKLELHGSADIPIEKEIAELTAVIRAYQAIVGKKGDPLPKDHKALMEYAAELDAEYAAAVKKGETAKATVFMKDESGWPIISSHMIVGNLKANLKAIVNNGDKSIVKTKVACGEICALDVKPIEDFMRPSKDIVRDGEGKPVLCERPIQFERMGKKETAIAQSEALPVGTEMSCTLRVRKDSPFTEKGLRTLFDLGKSNGLGAWRGSGNRGAYVYKLTALPGYVETLPEGWN
jgi:hypothetical protein